MSIFNSSSSSAVFNFLSNENELSWNAMIVSAQSWINANKASNPGLRVLISLSDGTVAFDSNSSLNSFVDFKEKKINENHNSRVALMSALISSNGVGLELKFSISTNQFTNYIAQCVGLSSQNSMGCVRISINQ